MKKNLITIIIFVLLLTACGQEGTLHVYQLKEKRQVVDSLILKYYEKYPKYLPTHDWEKYKNEIKDRVPFLKFYFILDIKENQMLVYKFSGVLQNNLTEDTKQNCRIAI
jgi:hypothetical protein